MRKQYEGRRKRERKGGGKKDEEEDGWRWKRKINGRGKEEKT